MADAIPLKWNDGRSWRFENGDVVPVAHGGTGAQTADAARIALGAVAYGDIKLHSGAAIPDGWMLCEGQLLAIADYPLLFAALGASYGGDGVNHFALPDYRHTGAGARRIICVDYHAPQPVLQVTVPAGIVGPVSGIYWPGDPLSFSVQLLEPVTVTGGPPKLAIAIGANTTLLSRLSATATLWTYEHVVQAGDFGAISATIDLNGAALTVATLPAAINSNYASSTVLGMQLVGAEAVMTPAASPDVITQNHPLSAVEATMTPTAETNAITI